MQIHKMTGEECKKLRPLWEEVFYEDSVQFTDYYFEHKAEKNKGYVIGNTSYDAMMFRTPYNMQIGEELRSLSYIVGVATRKECRHRGYMRALLTHAMEEMYEEKGLLLGEKDLIIMAAPSVPGVEVIAVNVLDLLYRTGAKIVNISGKKISSMHAQEEDIKTISKETQTPVI